MSLGQVTDNTGIDDCIDSSIVLLLRKSALPTPVSRLSNGHTEATQGVPVLL